MQRRKCALQACPHHHYALDSIGGIRIFPVKFPCDWPTLEKWLDFILLHNRAPLKGTKGRYICSAHFLPRLIVCVQRGALGVTERLAVPTISPNDVWDLAIECRDMRPVKLISVETEKSSPVLLLEETKKNLTGPDQGLKPTLQRCKRKNLGDFSLNEIICPQKSRIALQVIDSTLVKIWRGNGIARQDQGSTAVIHGKEIEAVEKCHGKCYID